MSLMLRPPIGTARFPRMRGRDAFTDDDRFHRWLMRCERGLISRILASAYMARRAKQMLIYFIVTRTFDDRSRSAILQAISTYIFRQRHAAASDRLS